MKIQKQMGGWNDFKKLLRKKALKLISDKNLYTNSNICQICKNLTTDMFIKSFSIYLYKDRERSQFMVFHSECILKRRRFLFKKRFSDKLNEILITFDWVVEFRKKNFLKRFYIKIRKKRTNISRKGGF